MLLVLVMLLDPERGWRRAAESGRNVVRTLILHLFPLLLLGCLAEGYGIVHWGKPVGEFEARQTYPVGQAVSLEVVQFVSGLLIALIGACVLRTLADTFQKRQSYSQALVVSVFAFGPVYLARVADAFPAVNPWLSWGIAAVLTMALLYQGLPRVFYIDPAHAMGAFFSASVLLVLLSGISRLVLIMAVQPQLLKPATG